jgi:hypothetical protein
LKSLLQSKKECWLCRQVYDTETTQELDQHHCFRGCRRQTADRHGCWVWLCRQHHTGPEESVHSSQALDMWLKRECQRKFEEIMGKGAFLETFGINYL